jgi:putative NIF3 family GTP cyclohydrolase 1 type 2
MNTEKIMKIALDLAGLKEIPADSGIQVPAENIKKVCIGVDIYVEDLMLAKHLGADLVIAHHPVGNKQLIELSKVMDHQLDTMVANGVPINKAQKLLSVRQNKVDISTHGDNYDKVSNAAKLLNMGLMNLHQPADVITEKFITQHLNDKFKGNDRVKLSEVVEALKELPEYKNAETEPNIVVGSESSYAGKICVTMAGGTGGGTDISKAYFEAGVGTLIEMHMGNAEIEDISKQGIGNVIVAGHMASDSVGLNKIIETLRNNGLEVIILNGIIE